MASLISKLPKHSVIISRNSIRLATARSASSTVLGRPLLLASFKPRRRPTQTVRVSNFHDGDPPVLRQRLSQVEEFLLDIPMWMLGGILMVGMVEEMTRDEDAVEEKQIGSSKQKKEVTSGNKNSREASTAVEDHKKSQTDICDDYHHYEEEERAQDYEPNNENLC